MFLAAGKDDTRPSSSGGGRHTWTTEALPTPSSGHDADVTGKVSTFGMIRARGTQRFRPTAPAGRDHGFYRPPPQNRTESKLSDTICREVAPSAGKLRRLQGTCAVCRELAPSAGKLRGLQGSCAVCRDDAQPERKMRSRNARCAARTEDARPERHCLTMNRSVACRHARHQKNH
jgi:hypothetical protein